MDRVPVGTLEMDITVLVSSPMHNQGVSNYLLTCPFIDNDECNTNSSICQQVCTNTPGSFICSCQDGYTMISNEVCTGKATFI